MLQKYSDQAKNPGTLPAQVMKLLLQTPKRSYDGEPRRSLLRHTAQGYLITLMPLSAHSLHNRMYS